MYYWGTVDVKEHRIKTDLLAYKERSVLLLPEIGEENRFMINSQRGTVEYRIGSSSQGQFEFMKAFFEELYGVEVISCDPPESPMNGRVIQNSRRNGKKVDFYYPSFLAAVVNIPNMIPEIRIQYQVVIRSSRNFMGKKRYSFVLLIGDTGSSESSVLVSDLLKNEFRSLRRRYRWRFTQKRNAGRLRPTVLKEPFSLSSFVRIVSIE